MAPPTKAASTMQLKFLEPHPLEGVKSTKKPIFSVLEAELVVGSEACKVDDVKLSLNSRIMAVGQGGRAAVALLKDESQVSSGEVWRQNNLNVVHLAPSELSGYLTGDDYIGAINAAMELRPQVVIIDECVELQNAAWAQAFKAVACSDVLCTFGGAIVVLCSDETLSVSRLCPETWILQGKLVRSVASLEMYDVTLRCNGDKDVELDSVSEFLLEQALAIEDEKAGKDHNLKLWMDKCLNEPCHIKLFASIRADGQRSLRGFLCHEMIESFGEFHIRFVYVPEEHRSRGLGSRLIHWTMATARRMPKSKCKWLSLEAADEDLVEYYERFGFCDFGGENEDGNTWMEVANESIVVEDDECDM